MGGAGRQPMSRLLRPVWGVCFGFGLSPGRATATVLVLLAIGTGRRLVGLEAGRRAGGQLLLRDDRGDRRARLPGPGQGQATAGAPPCGDNDIQPVFYAMDMMVPVMALQQVDKCWVDTRPGTAGWRVFWSVFSFVGKLVTSLALLTYSGVLKPREEA